MATKKSNQTVAAEPSAPGAAEILVTMRKGDETLDVHPTCVAAHKAAGWVEV